MTTRVWSIAAGVMIASILVGAQTPEPARFDVASIKRNRSGDNAIGGGGTRGETLLNNSLSYVAQRRVIHQTGLTGRFDLELTWDPNAGTPDRASSDLPSLFTAVREQLGLRLEPGKARVPVLVVDSIEPPTED